MKFKLDENFGVRTAECFRAGGHDVRTARDEQLGGAADARLYETCCAEQRCLVTLDLDFSDPIRFDPGACGGIVVIRLPVNPSLPLLVTLIQQFLAALGKSPLERSLWVVEPGRIRIHQREDS